ncbi:hypothetical protein [Methylomicrobium lacus]|uniref:hypothetical protein n=1 Tax=Methylomicrobium lacus TaxID=136992 RepID=UPI0035A833C6
MFRPERIFNQLNPKTGRTEWFFYAREGIFGPFISKESATKELTVFRNHCIATGNDGGRSKTPNKTLTLSLLPMSDFAIKRRG